MSYLLVNIDSYLNFIKYQSSTANTKDKGDAFEALVYCYLTLHLGIDILAETFEGHDSRPRYCG